MAFFPIYTLHNCLQSSNCFVAHNCLGTRAGSGSVGSDSTTLLRSQALWESAWILAVDAMRKPWACRRFCDPLIKWPLSIPEAYCTHQQAQIWMGNHSHSHEQNRACCCSSTSIVASTMSRISSNESCDWEKTFWLTWICTKRTRPWAWKSHLQSPKQCQQQKWNGPKWIQLLQINFNYDLRLNVEFMSKNAD